MQEMSETISILFTLKSLSIKVPGDPKRDNVRDTGERTTGDPNRVDDHVPLPPVTASFLDPLVSLFFDCGWSPFRIAPPTICIFMYVSLIESVDPGDNMAS